MAEMDQLKHEEDREAQKPPGPSPPGDMAWVPGGTFLMGSNDFFPEERPVHTVAVDGFWMDEHPVTAWEFRRNSVARPP